MVLSPALETFVPFLIYRLMAKGAALATTDYARFAISIQEARLLMLVHRHPGLSAGDLSEMACLEASALSHLLRDLTNKGLIVRRRRAEERRVVEVFVTSKGAALARRCERIAARHQDILLHSMSEKTIAELRNTLNAMLENVQDYHPGSSPWRKIARTSKAAKVQPTRPTRAPRTVIAPPSQRRVEKAAARSRRKY